MRVTNSMLVSNYLNNLNTNLTKLSDLQTQMASGKKYAHISDDPVSVIYSQQARYKLSRLEHYKSNVDLAGSWLTQAEAGVMEMNEVLQSAYETCISISTDVMSPEDRANAVEYLGQLRDQILQTLNTTFGDKYAYGAYNTTGNNTAGKTVAPFTVDEVTGNLLFNGVDLTDPANNALIEEMRKDVLTFDLAIGTDMPVTVNGIDLVFYDSYVDPNTGETVNLNIYNMVSDLYNTVTNGGSVDDITPYITRLQDAQSHTLAITADIGGRVNRLEILSSRYEQDEINYTQMLSDAEDADEAEVIMNFMMAKSVYDAALASGTYIITRTLMDFLN